MTSVQRLRGFRADLDQRAAALVAEALTRRAAEAAQVVLGVVGGRSVGGLYRALRNCAVPWSKLHVFLVDERRVPATSDESNYKLVREDLLDGPLRDGRLGEAQTHPFPFRPGADEAGVAAYDRQLREVGGRFDVVVLSAGEDGHTASLFPRHPSIQATDDGFLLVEKAPKPPPRRVSASRRLLERTSLGVLVFYGEEKRDALQRFRVPGVDPVECPAALVNSMDAAVVLTDLD